MTSPSKTAKDCAGKLEQAAAIELTTNNLLPSEIILRHALAKLIDETSAAMSRIRCRVEDDSIPRYMIFDGYCDSFILSVPIPDQLSQWLMGSLRARND